MQKISIEQALRLVTKIDDGIRDHVTSDSRFTPLWQHHFLRESFYDLLEHADGVNGEFYRHNFENVCAVMAPEFAAIIEIIDLPAKVLTSAL
jgi:hypothetical protein